MHCDAFTIKFIVISVKTDIRVLTDNIWQVVDIYYKNIRPSKVPWGILLLTCTGSENEDSTMTR